MFCYDHWLVSFLKFLILALHAWWTVLYEKVNGVTIHPVWKWASCCPLVNRLKIDHAVWCVCWLVTHVFALYLFQLLKDPYFEWAYLRHCSTIRFNLSGDGCAQSRFTKSLWTVGQAKHSVGCYFPLKAWVFGDWPGYPMYKTWGWLDLVNIVNSDPCVALGAWSSIYHKESNFHYLDLNYF